MSVCALLAPQLRDFKRHLVPGVYIMRQVTQGAKEVKGVLLGAGVQKQISTCSSKFLPYLRMLHFQHMLQLILESTSERENWVSATLFQNLSFSNSLPFFFCQDSDLRNGII
jgi:hypothetical protein